MIISRAVDCQVNAGELVLVLAVRGAVGADRQGVRLPRVAQLAHRRFGLTLVVFFPEERKEREGEGAGGGGRSSVKLYRALTNSREASTPRRHVWVCVVLRYQPVC